MSELVVMPIHPVTGQTAIGILPKSGRIVWPILGASDDHEDEEQDDKEEQDEDDDKAKDKEQDEEGEDEEQDDGDEELGEKGLKALQAEKAKRRRADDRRRKAEAELAKLRDGDGDAVTQARLEVEAKANLRIVKASIRAVAAGKFADPADAVLYLDPTVFEVDEDGDVDEEEIGEALADLLKKKPHLAAQGGKRFQGTGDNGARPKSKKPSRPTSLGDAVARKYAK